ncbi:MAG: dienelactone hydrolase family protein [Chitinophagales bacterium]|nr:dienelactone hydrolase family protein [Chitinophagales bacterium]
MLKKLLIILALATVFTACQGEANSTEGGDNPPSTEDAQDAPEALEVSNTSISGEMIEFPTSDGTPAKAYLLMQPDNTPTNDYLFVFHGWKGLNDYAKQEAERLYQVFDSVNVIAIDLYDGEKANNQLKARNLITSADKDRLNAVIRGAIDKVGPDANISTIGWSFGGEWSLRTAIMAGSQAKACVVYYGRPVNDASLLASLEAPVFYAYARNDKLIKPNMIKNFKLLMQSSNKQMQLISYNGGHSFANSSTKNYEESSAQKANEASMEFLVENMWR